MSEPVGRSGNRKNLKKRGKKGGMGRWVWDGKAKLVRANSRSLASAAGARQQPFVSWEPARKSGLEKKLVDTACALTAHTPRRPWPFASPHVFMSLSTGQSSRAVGKPDSFKCDGASVCAAWR